MSKTIPIIAILANSALVGVGLRTILEKMFPFAAFKVCDEFEQIEGCEPEELFHIFVSANIVLEHRDFFERRRHKTIILSSGSAHAQLIEGFAQINVEGRMEQVEESLMRLHSSAHGGGHTMAPRNEERELLSAREIEVLRLVVEGLINKEIADRLNIALATVISHRKNIVEKVGVKSVAGLTIYAVMKRYITI